MTDATLPVETTPAPVPAPAPAPKAPKGDAQLEADRERANLIKHGESKSVAIDILAPISTQNLKILRFQNVTWRKAVTPHPACSYIEAALLLRKSPYNKKDAEALAKKA